MITEQRGSPFAELHAMLDRGDLRTVRNLAAHIDGKATDALTNPDRVTYSVVPGSVMDAEAFVRRQLALLDSENPAVVENATARLLRFWLCLSRSA